MVVATKAAALAAGVPVRATQSTFVAGVDLGQRQDYTAIAVMETEQKFYDARDPWDYQIHSDTAMRLRHVGRMKLGTPYPEIVESVHELVTRLQAHGTTSVAVDATGVGLPVVQMLRERCRGTRIVPVTITGGERPSSDGWMHYVPKRDLVSGLQLAFEKREIAIASELPLMSEVMRELMTMQVKVTPAGRERFEAWREGDHDDLVLAIALAWWRSARKEPPVWGRRPLPRIC
jgi:hypothetical protein